jgi:hypothetical protein
MQELQTMNVKMAIITEDNIDQFDNMNFSQNISLLTKGLVLNDIVDNMDKEINKIESVKPKKYYEMDDYSEPEDSPKPRTVMSTPDFDMLDNIEYVPNSPEYNGSPGQSPVQSPGESSGEPPYELPYELQDNRRQQDNLGEGIRREPTIPQFNVGDEVSFLGDFKQSRKWIIREFEKGFVVLETNDGEGLDNNVKVVGLSDITRYVGQPVVEQPMVQPLSAQPIISPIFNIVNGNDNKVETSEPVIPSTVDFSQPKIRIKEPETQQKELKQQDLGNGIVVKKIE